MPRKSKYYGPSYQATSKTFGKLIRNTGGRPVLDWAGAQRISPAQAALWRSHGSGIGGLRIGAAGMAPRGVRRAPDQSRLVSTPLGQFEARDWGQEAMLDLAGTQREQTLKHAKRLRGIARDTASKATAGFSESVGAEVPGLVSLLSDYLHGRKSVTDMPAYSGAADYIEQAVRRSNAALGYNMSGNVANAVAENLQRFSMDAYSTQVGHIIDALGQHQRSAAMFPSDIYSDLMAQASQAQAQQYDPYGEVIGYISQLANERV